LAYTNVGYSYLYSLRGAQMATSQQ